MVEKLSHMYIVVENLDASLQFYTGMLGLHSPQQINELPEFGLRNAFVPLGDIYLELVEITNPKIRSLPANFLEKYGPGLFGIAVEVMDVEHEVETLRSKGLKVDEHPSSSDIPFKRGWVGEECGGDMPVELVPRRALPGLISGLALKLKKD